MITEAEINPHNYELDDEQKKNLPILLERINKVRTAYGKPMNVTSGVRSKADQIRIYKIKNDILAKQGKPIISVPLSSKHLKAAAVDIKDTDGSLMKWTLANEKLMISIGLWVEAGTVGWVHYQALPCASGKTYFKA